MRLSARVIVLDRKLEYDPPGALYAYSMREFADLFMAHRWEPFALVFRPRMESDYGRAMELARSVQQSEPHGPLVIVLEEASNYGSASGVDETVRQLYNAGRHERISMLAVIQVDTDFHRVARYGSEVIVTFRQHKLSADMQSMFALEQVAALRTLKEDFTHEPEQGVHFLTYPSDVDLYETWIDAHGYIVDREAFSGDS